MKQMTSEKWMTKAVLSTIPSIHSDIQNFLQVPLRLSSLILHTKVLMPGSYCSVSQCLLNAIPFNFQITIFKKYPRLRPLFEYLNVFSLHLYSTCNGSLLPKHMYVTLLTTKFLIGKLTIALLQFVSLNNLLVAFSIRQKTSTFSLTFDTDPVN